MQPLSMALRGQRERLDTRLAEPHEVAQQTTSTATVLKVLMREKSSGVFLPLEPKTKMKGGALCLLA